MSKSDFYLLTLITVLCTCTANAFGKIRIDDLKPTGHDGVSGAQQWCAHMQGATAGPIVFMNGIALPAHRVKPFGNALCFELAADAVSGPLWLRDEGHTSNAVWLSTRQTWVLAANQGRRVEIADYVVTDLELVSLVLSEKADGLTQAKRVAQQHDLEIVGAIPPLNVYQVRLPVTSLVARTDLLSQLRRDPAVMGVVVEDDNLEMPQNPERMTEPPDDEGWEANRLEQAVTAYAQIARGSCQRFKPANVVIGVIEKGVNFESVDFRGLAQPCPGIGTCLFARHSNAANAHGSIVTGILAARLYQQGNLGFLSRLGANGGRFDIILDRGASSGVTARIAASVNLVEDGARVLNWSWGVHLAGTFNLRGEPVETNVRSSEAMEGYALLLERFFDWLARHHPTVVVVNSAGNSGSTTDFHMPASLLSDQLVVVGAHQRTRRSANVAEPHFAEPRQSSNIGPRVDISAAACPRPPLSTLPKSGRGGGCGTSYAAALVTGVVAAIISINPELTPYQIKQLLRRSALPMAARPDQAVRIGYTLPITVVGGADEGGDATKEFARLDMYQAVMLALKSNAAIDACCDDPE
ncbi:S8/S53 family peptidase [Pseudomonas shirazensis]|uniref:S8/S53 family peptidase n=1 Tax=Pseudomonas shirazensis TaxID=2745494 RepID=UPI003D2780D5